MKEKLIIKQKGYSYRDGSQCCFEQVGSLEINGELLHGQLNICRASIEMICKYLGVDVEFQD